MEEEAHSLQLHVYDISHGLARLHSRAFVGIDLDAIYHTAIVAYNHEYYFDRNGPIKDTPGKTRFGIPMEVIDLGETYIPQEVFEEYLQELQTEKFGFGTYDLFHNNCNHFSNEVIQFLNGGVLEERILNLPEKVLNSPNGQMIKQLFTSFLTDI